MEQKHFKVGFVDWGLLLVLAMLWGSAFFWTALALRSVDASWIVAVRLVLAALTMHVAVRFMGYEFPNDLKTIKVFVVLGLVSNLIPFTAYTMSQFFITSSMAAVLNAFTPLSVLVLSQVFRLEDRMTWYNTTGLIAGITGVVVLMLPGLQGQGWEQAYGIVLAMIAAICYGLGSLYARRHQNIAPPVMAVGMVSCAAFMSLPVALISSGFNLPMPTTLGFWSLAALGLLCTATAYLLFFRLLSRVGPTNASTVALILPVTAMVLGVVILEERFSTTDVWGTAIILLGLVFVDGRLPKFLAKRFSFIA